MVVILATVLSLSFHVVITCLVHRQILLPPGAGPGVLDNSYLLTSVMGSHGVSVRSLREGPIQMFLEVVIFSGTQGHLFPQSIFEEV